MNNELMQAFIQELRNIPSRQAPYTPETMSIKEIIVDDSALSDCLMNFSYDSILEALDRIRQFYYANTNSILDILNQLKRLEPRIVASNNDEDPFF